MHAIANANSVCLGFTSRSVSQVATAVAIAVTVRRG